MFYTISHYTCYPKVLAMKKLYSFLLAIIVSVGAIAQSQIDLPITWDDTANVNYTTVPFGGNSSTLALDPTSSTNNVLQVNKPLGAASWAGVTMSTTSGLANLIPFDSNNNLIRVKVYSPDSGIVVKLKAEVVGTPTQSVETDETTTVANGWETLEFDFTNESTGTAAINYSYNYNMLSIFFNFGVDGNTAGAKTYYADSVYFVGGGTVTPPDTNMVTFRVDMNQYGGSFTTPEVNGDFNGWCGGCNALSDNDGDGIWEATLPLTQDSIEFKYAYDAWTGQEDLAGLTACTKTTGAFTNRFIYIDADTTLPAVCWESCIECVTPPDTHMITFQVDMNQYSGTFTTPEVNGDFNGWCGNCNAMSDGDGDNIWDVTIPLWQDSIEYKFAHDSWAGQEELTPGSACTKTTGAFTNRFLIITGDTTLPPVCWASCDVCGIIPDTFDVTFNVDMRGYSGTYTTPEVNGTFNGWCGNCNAMADPEGDSVWTVTISLWQDSIEYKFSHDTWTGQEELTVGDPCTKTTGAFTNRFIYINGDTILPEVCWASCDVCDTTTGIGVVATAKLDVYPNPVSDNLRIESEEGIQAITLFNTTGELVLSTNGLGRNAMNINMADLANGIYILKAHTQEGVATKRLIVAK